MNKTLGISGYVTLIISAPFLDIPFLGLLAVPIFLLGTILLTVFFLKLIAEKYEFRFLNSAMVIAGVLLLCGTIGYSSTTFTEYLVSMHRDEALLYSPFQKIVSIATISVVSSFLVFLAIRKSEKLSKRTLKSYWLPTFFIIPVVLVFIKLLELIGTPLSA